MFHVYCKYTVGAYPAPTICMYVQLPGFLDVNRYTYQIRFISWGLFCCHELSDAEMQAIFMHPFLSDRCFSRVSMLWRNHNEEGSKRPLLSAAAHGSYTVEQKQHVDEYHQDASAAQHYGTRRSVHLSDQPVKYKAIALMCSLFLAGKSCILSSQPLM